MFLQLNVSPAALVCRSRLCTMEKFIHRYKYQATIAESENAALRNNYCAATEKRCVSIQQRTVPNYIEKIKTEPFAKIQASFRTRTAATANQLRLKKVMYSFEGKDDRHGRIL